MKDSDIRSRAFEIAELRSERNRVGALLGVLGGLLALVLVRAGMSWAEGHRGEAWPFALLLAMMTAYELVWRRFVVRALETGGSVSRSKWIGNTAVELLLPTLALILQVHTPSFGPHRALTSPVILVFLLFIILSTLHLDPVLSVLNGILSAVGYAATAIYVFLVFPEVTASEPLLVYTTSFSVSAFLLLGGFAAGAVARQIRQHVIAALDEAENRARLAQFEQVLGLARSIQQGLLPRKPPVIEEFDVAGWNQPADETGGDYFDWQELADGRVAVTVADVTGHGIASALIMSACRAYARAGLAVDPDPQRYLRRLNQLLHEDLPTEKFVTLVSGLLDPSHARMQLISAGHGPLLFYSPKTDTFRSIDAQGPPLGLLSNWSYGTAQNLEFDIGDILVLVTDGFIEWTNASGEDFGVDRLEKVVRENRDQRSETIISELHSTILKFAGTMPQNDDLTALVVKRVQNNHKEGVLQ